MLYLHSTYHVEPGKMDEYLDIVERLQLPGGERGGLHLVGYWTTHPLSGPPTDITAIYSFANWSSRDPAPGPQKARRDVGISPEGAVSPAQVRDQVPGSCALFTPTIGLRRRNHGRP